MNILIKLFLIITLSQAVFATPSKYYQGKFDTTKKLYLGSIMSDNRAKEIRYLKKLIQYGKKINIDVLKYQRELNRLDKKQILKNKITTVSVIKPKYSIKSVVQDDNSIVITFHKRINASYIKFSERKDKYNFYDQFDIKGNFKDARPTKLSLYGVKKILIYQYKKNILRLVFKNKKNLKTIYIIDKNKIIIKVLNVNTQSKSNKSIKKVQMLDKQNFYPSSKVIVIDAGHGGSDSGAVGRNRNYEKRIVLNVAQYLRKELQKDGFKVYLTRTRDKYIKLSRRTKYANRKKADLFISIHANAARKSRAKKAHGIETYFLSPARSARAKRVAAIENRGDMNKMGWSSKNSLLTILNQSKITESNKMAIDIQKNMLHQLRQKYGKSKIRDGGVREGPFWVLVGAQMPSVLVEVGYISHPSEGRRIATKTYQKNIAKGIAKGIESYFIKN
ncbi:N-acetylmuramoyl-L-alanine amidase [Arcobacteraceae bacterium]|nr:N-acetylmuramoyl-L-alanine amidase [Arcobacteraceae bacterium]